MVRSSTPRHVPGSVIVGYDGSTHGKAALAWGARRAAERAVPVHVVHAFAPDIPALAFGSLTSLDDVTAAGRELLDQASAAVHADLPDVPVQTTLASGYASKALLSAAHDAAMIVVGTSGSAVVRLSPVGVVARQVTAHAPCPVALVGREPGAPDGPVVVGWDESPEALRALKVASEQAGMMQRPLVVVHAWQPVGRQDPTLTAGASWADYVAATESAIRTGLAKVGGPGAAVTIDVVQGEPRRELVERSSGAVLTVVGARGAGGFDGLRLGTVSTSLIGHTHGPLLVTRGRRVTEPY